MSSPVLRGVVAGALGTTALNVTTYLDMAVRARPASSVVAADVRALAERLHVPLDAGTHEDGAQARTEALGALMGFATGALAGAVYGAVRGRARGVPRAAAAVALGLGVMAATDGVSTALGATDPRSWSAADWASDVVPHLVFGAATAYGFDALEH
jgi:hypothetical protein